MQQYTVSFLSVAAMAAAALMGIAIPVVLFFVFRKKFGTGMVPFFTGCAVFIIFALALEGTVNLLIFTSGAGAVIKGNIWLYGIVGGLMAGLFEETGRYTAFRTVLKKKRGDDHNALMYGAGHGGFEAFYILFFSMITYLVMAVKLNAGMYDSSALQTLGATFRMLADTPPAMYLLSVAERFAAVAFHISNSVLVWFAAKNGGRRFLLYPLAMLLHALFNAFAVILGSYVSNLLLVEGAIYLFAAFCAVLAHAVWKNCAGRASAEGEL